VSGWFWRCPNCNGTEEWNACFLLHESTSDPQHFSENLNIKLRTCAKLGFLLSGNNTDWGCLRTRRWRRYLGPKKNVRNYIRSYLLCRLRGMGWFGCGAYRRETRDSYKVWLENLKKTSFWRYRRRWEDNIEMDVLNIWTGLKWLKIRFNCRLLWTQEWTLRTGTSLTESYQILKEGTISKSWRIDEFISQSDSESISQSLSKCMSESLSVTQLGRAFVNTVMNLRVPQRKHDIFWQAERLSVLKIITCTME